LDYKFNKIMLIIDGHLDLAMNAIEWNRDLTQPVEAIRARELGMTDKRDRAKNTVSLPALRQGGVGLVVATQIARFVAPNSTLDGWHSPAQAWAMTQAQLAWYKAMVDLGEMAQITTKIELQNHIDLWQNDTISNINKPVGFILSLEGADSLINLDYLHNAYQNGLRAIGPAHYGPGRYAAGTGMTAGFTDIGRSLLQEMNHLQMILDVTHLTDRGFDEALDSFGGNVWASHHNCRNLVPHQRQLSDNQIKKLIDRGAVIGAAMDAWMLAPGFIQRQSNPKDFGVTMQTVIEHWDYICQIAGNTNHVAFGTDLDGMFGQEQSPSDLYSIADLPTYADLLTTKGYSKTDIENIFYRNWLRLMMASLP
jgi:membrane dipeptidase